MKPIEFIRGLMRDLRFAVRILRKSPIFAGVAILSLSLGIGANTAIFSLVDAVMLRSLPVKDPEQLVELITVQNGKPYNSFSYVGFEQLRDQNRSLSGLLAIADKSFYTVIDGGAPEKINGQFVSGNYFSALGVSATLGRDITPEDDRFGAPNQVAIISYAYWKKRFALEPAVVGKNIIIEDVPFTISGVMPSEFTGVQTGARVDFWVPLSTETLMRRPSFTSSAGYKWLQLMGRLRPGVEIEQARADLTAVFQQAVITPEMALTTDPAVRQQVMNWKFAVEPAGNGLSSLRVQFSKPLTVLMAAATLVLLIACINLANLLLARATSRHREIAIRLALGASRRRLIMQLLTESMLLALIGGGLGVLFAYKATGFLLEMIAAGATTATGVAPVFLEAGVNLRLLLFTGALSISTAFIFGLAPALKSTMTNIVFDLKGGGRGVEIGGARQLSGKILIVSQLALSLILVIVGGLFNRTLQNLRGIDLGFEHEKVLLVSLDPSHSGYKPEQARSIVTEIVDRLQAVPGVHSASLSWITPIRGGGTTRSISVDGYTRGPDESSEVYVNWVAPRYFETLSTPFVAGRDFASSDTSISLPVAIVNDKFARHYFGAVNPIGRRINFEGDKTVDIVGVVADSKYVEIRETIALTVYLNTSQRERTSTELVVRTTVPPASLAPTLRREIQRIAGNIAIDTVKTLTSQIDASLIQERLIAMLSGFFGIVGLILSSIGLYGVVAYGLSRRTGEIGVRLALGAQRRDIIIMVSLEIATLISIGFTSGIIGALALGSMVSGLVYGLVSVDPVTIIEAVLLMLSVLILAIYAPIARASRVDPMVCLREE